jgi:peptide-methionine (R)-S-oxide reductase
MPEIERTDADWREALSSEQYEVLRRAGTERAFTGAYTDLEDSGVYRCAGCESPLFRSDTKFHSGSGWPSFSDAISPDVVTLTKDRSFLMVRTEVTCARCGGHLGHLFDDGPRETTGLRYCMNSAALDFEPVEDPVEPT